MTKRNAQKELEQLLLENERAGRRPTLLLHSCCAPCSSYVLEYLAEPFEITVLYYNPNISPEEEARKRSDEVKRLIASLPQTADVRFIEGKYDPERFFLLTKGLEKAPEGGARCEVCFRMRLMEAALAAKEGGFDYFATTLTISPLKNAELLNAIGEEIALKTGTKYLPSDFKKKNGYKRSVELSAQYGLYRQDYCGCIFSKLERESKESFTEA